MSSERVRLEDKGGFCFMRIPAFVLMKADMKLGDVVEITVEDGRIVLRKTS